MRLLLVFLLYLPFTLAGALDYQLQVRLDPVARSLTGTAVIVNDSAVNLATDGLLEVRADGWARTEKNLQLAPGTHRLEYRYALDSVDSFALTGLWYPRPDSLARYALQAILPEGFQAVSEADSVSADSADGQTTFRFDFPHPLDSLSLIAAHDYQIQRLQYGAIQIESYFLPANAALAQTYLDAARTYLALYEKLLTPYPYKRFAIVENPLPTGYAMPTFTLLGSQVVRLPFIIETSLGHEILHQWFGNLVYIDSAHGNWAEGLTHYLAEHWYAEQRGEGAAFRKKLLNDYAAYSDAALTVRDFHSRQDKAQSAVGYGKAAMIFHLLRQRLGDERFFSAMRGFIEANRFRAASWHDLQRAFEDAGGAPLYGFFEDWLTRADAPRIEVSKPAQVRLHQGRLEFSVELAQGENPYPLRLPLTFYTAAGNYTAFRDFDQARQEFVLTLDEPPLRVVVDENYDLMRAPAEAEAVPNLARLLGAPDLLAAVSAAELPRYQALLDALKPAQIVEREDVTFARVKQHSVLIAGYDNDMARMLVGDVAVPEQGVALKVYAHPYKPGAVIALLHARDAAEAEAAAPKLGHYGQYTDVAFEGGRNTLKETAPTANGIELYRGTPTRAVQPAQLSTIEGIVPQLANKRVVFVGEQHTRFEHHLNQWLIIKKLAEGGRKVAIGLEMFQQPYQQVLDDYLGGRIGEAEFLRNSHYFANWSYDYNLYKMILDYAKERGLPVVALNIDGDINRKIGRHGIPSLTCKEREHLPGALNFADIRYREDLREVFAQHQNLANNNLEAFDCFLQGQVVWDESMAENAAKFLQDKPDTLLVVLAGNGHLRYGYGIPQRLHRRAGLSYAIVLQDEELTGGIADYVLLSSPLQGTETPLMGVYADNQDGRLVVHSVNDNSPAARAGLQKDDVVTALDGKPVASLAELKMALFYADTGNPVTVTLERAGQTLVKQLDFSAAADPRRH